MSDMTAMEPRRYFQVEYMRVALPALAAKDRRIKALEAENRKLKEEFKVAYGKLYEKV